MPEPPKAYRDADHHAVSAVIKWVEQGVAPEKLIATCSAAAIKLIDLKRVHDELRRLEVFFRHPWIFYASCLSFFPSLQV